MQDKYCFNPNSYCPGHDNKRLAVEANASRLSDLPCSVLDKITHIEYKISLLLAFHKKKTRLTEQNPKNKNQRKNSTKPKNQKN